MVEGSELVRLSDFQAHLLLLEQKVDALRVELQENSRDSHQRLHDRIDDIEKEVKELKVQLTEMTPTFEAMKRHMETDVPVDAARDKAISKGVLYVLGLTVSGFVGWLFSHFGGGK